MNDTTVFEAAYEALNSAQKRAVDSLDGPVMVIAGPGTGKTQILALRIANILLKTDTSADGILCLTFTNAGVKAMRERLLTTIGPTALKVHISTFHAFALTVIEEFGIEHGMVPVLMDDSARVALFDELLHMREWNYLRPRANPGQYFRDISSTISFLKRDRIAPEEFQALVTQDIERLQNDPASISSRGESKGQLKKEILSKIESLQRSFELGTLYTMYEALKKERNSIDYNDVLELLVRVVEENDEATASIREKYLYVLVDEHQDSSGIQNEFLSVVWSSVEQPNLFVVGDDRQLIYGFGGASLAYFEGFKEQFGKAQLITLTKNYRSTQTILDAAEALLTSTLTTEKLESATIDTYPLSLIECDYERDEIILAALHIKEAISHGVEPHECAILVPKNYQVTNAIQILRGMNISVSAASQLKLFAQSDTRSFLSILHSINAPTDSTSLSQTILDPLSCIPTLRAHQFLSNAPLRKLAIDDLIDATEESIRSWGTILAAWIELSHRLDAYALIQTVGEKLFLADVSDDEVLRKRIEILRTLLHLALSLSQKKAMRSGKVTLSEFLVFISRLQEYGEDIPLAVFESHTGVRVLTLHGSKGLEFQYVWIAHMDERSLMGTRRSAFTLPETVQKINDDEHVDVAKRQLYVAITRAKKYLTISYAVQSYTGASQELAPIIQALPENTFEKVSREQSEQKILANNARLYIGAPVAIDTTSDTVSRIADLVALEYEKRKVSVTMLNNFYECPWKWYFRNLLALPEKVTESLHIGTVVHEGIEYVLKGGKEISQELNRVALIEARGDDVYATHLVATAAHIIESWQKNYARDIMQQFNIERNFVYKDPDFAHLTITGKIDMVEEISTTEVRVTDWKTGSTKTRGEIEKRDEEGRMSSYLRQLSMYSYLVEGVSNGNTEVKESRLIFLEAKPGDKNNVQSVAITRENIEALKHDIVDYDEAITSGRWIKRPCCVKSYSKDTACEYCALAEKFGVLRKEK